MGFNEAGFRRKLDKAMETVRKILDVTRIPRYAENQEHVYDDKYGLAEFLTNSALAAQVNVLERMGLMDEDDNDKSSTKLQKIMDMVHRDHRSVTLRLSADETCQFLKKKVVEVISPRQATTQVSETRSWKSSPGRPTTQGSESKSSNSTKKETKTYHQQVATKVKEYHWVVAVSYTLFAYAGSDPESDDNRVVLQSRVSSTVLITTGNKQQEPLPQHKTRPPIDVSLTWLLQNLTYNRDKQHVCSFQIDRTKDTCRTPRRNDDIREAIRFFAAMTIWSISCRDYFVNQVERQILGLHCPAGAVGDGAAGGGHRRQLYSINAEEIFVPVLPLMEAPENKSKNATTKTAITAMMSSNGDQSSPLLSLGDVNCFLNEQRRSLDEAISSLERAYPKKDENGQVVSVAEAKQVMLGLHTVDIKDHWFDGIDYIEQMLRNQLAAAIGKEVHPHDFDEFIRFHNRKLLGEAYKPHPFCYAIRRPNHYPDGIVSIEGSSGDSSSNDDGKDQPIESIVRKLSGDTAPPMFIPINAATSVEFAGERYLHAWIHHRFASISHPERKHFKLIARARQFSSFLLMVGTISGPDKFDPKDAIILQNKDEVLIPLLLNELPTAKEFKDAISSLSPEQQQFAKSFRGMQLESSVFGVCVVQLKPQLEELLGLPSDALTKEIGLTQDLLSLFIDYQIPSDLLSFDGPPDVPVLDKVVAVKGYVRAVKDVIDNEKTKQLEEAAKEADMRAEEEEAWSPTSAQYFGGFPAVTPARAQQFRRGEDPAAGKAMMDMPEGSVVQEYEKEEEEEEACGEVDGIVADAPTASSSGKSVSISQGDRLRYQDTADVGSAKSDFTAIPKKLNATFEKHDTDNALRTTIIKAGDEWTRARQPNLLTKKVTEKVLGANEQKTEKNKAFDLLDALSRSGTLPIACAELHVVFGVSHCFESTVMGTVIEENVNPIEKIEKSTLLIASTIHGVEVPILLDGGSAESASRWIGQFHPALTESSEV